MSRAMHIDGLRYFQHIWSLYKQEGGNLFHEEIHFLFLQHAVQGTSIKPDAERIEKGETEMIPQATESSAVQRNHLLKNEESSFNLDVQACSSTGTETTNTTGNRLESISSKTEWVSQDEASQSSVHQGEIQELALNQATERGISNSAGSQDVSRSSNIPRHQRIACQYGRICYR